jgi:hypothetical protein
MIYSASFYGSFGINVFDYAEVPDFLLAAFRNFPISFVSAGVSVVAGISLADLLAKRERWLMRRTHLEAERDAQKQQTLKREEQVVRQQMAVHSIIIILSFLFAFFVLPYGFATLTASSIKRATYGELDVRYRSFSGSAGQVTEPDLMLIGSTQRAVFFYDYDHKRTIVIPQAQIVSIEVPE